MSEQGAKPEVLPGDLITRPGLYESRSQGVVEVRHWGRDGWVAQWGDKERIYFSDGTRTGLYPMPDPYQLLHWVGPLPASEPESETTTEQLAEIEGQAEPEPVPESDAELRVRLLKQANDSQAETIARLLTEARDLNMEIGGLQRQLLQRDARIRDLETMHAAATQAVVDAGKANDKLRNLANNLRQQFEAAANEISEQRSYLDKYDKQLDQKDAQIRDLRIELDAAQQVPQPVGDEERERIWNEATEAAGRQVVRWLRPLTLALNRQPDERFSRFMALTLSVLPDLLPELLGYAVEDEADGEE